eukprot:4957153-Alexandrium_andersonii.AAC.1
MGQQPLRCPVGGRLLVLSSRSGGRDGGGADAPPRERPPTETGVRRRHQGAGGHRLRRGSPGYAREAAGRAHGGARRGVQA